MALGKVCFKNLQEDKTGTSLIRQDLTHGTGDLAYKTGELANETANRS